MTTGSDPEGGTIYIRRDAQGQIMSLSRAPAPDHRPADAEDEADIAAFVHAVAPGPASLAQSDLALIRVIEDVIDVLIDKEILRLTDLPGRAQEKLLSRQQLRSSLRSLTLFGDDDETL